MRLGKATCREADRPNFPYESVTASVSHQRYVRFTSEALDSGHSDLGSISVINRGSPANFPSHLRTGRMAQGNAAGWLNLLRRRHFLMQAIVANWIEKLAKNDLLGDLGFSDDFNGLV